MKNEKGVTLIELLATLTIAIIVAGTLFLVFSQVNYEWRSTTNKYNDDNQSRLAMDTITKYLVDTNTLVYITDSSGTANELRFKSGASGYKAIVLLNGTLSLYSLNMNSTDFLNKDVTFSNSQSEYLNRIVLSTTIQDLFMYQTVDTLGNPVKYTSSQVFDNRQLLHIQGSFFYKKTSASVSNTIQTQVIKNSIKLLQDH